MFRQCSDEVTKFKLNRQQIVTSLQVAAGRSWDFETRLELDRIVFRKKREQASKVRSSICKFVRGRLDNWGYRHVDKSYGISNAKVTGC